MISPSIKSPCTVQNKTIGTSYHISTLNKNVVELCRWGRGSSHRSGVATQDGDTKALEEESHCIRQSSTGKGDESKRESKFALQVGGQIDRHAE